MWKGFPPLPEKNKSWQANKMYEQYNGMGQPKEGRIVYLPQKAYLKHTLFCCRKTAPGSHKKSHGYLPWR
jgi:hypothetical protein